MKNEKIMKVLVYTLGISLVIAFIFHFCCLEIFSNIFIGIFSSAFVVLVIELVSRYYDSKKYSFLDGKYNRLGIYNEPGAIQADGTIYSEMMERYNKRGVSQEIEMNYCGTGEYKGIAKYEEGDVEFIINLNLDNPNTGVGTYQYIKKHEGYKMPDLGTYKIQVDKLNPKKIYVFHKNLIPSGVASGYEIWERVN